ncbi:hypothetical protein [Brevibacterium sediminis]
MQTEILNAVGVFAQSIGVALALATLVSTVGNSFGRARLQRRCEFYRNQIETPNGLPKLRLEALHAKFAARLIALDSFPARRTQFQVHAVALFVVLQSIYWAFVVAVQDEMVREPALIMSIGMIFPGSWFCAAYGCSIAFKRADIRRMIAGESTNAKELGTKAKFSLPKHWDRIYVWLAPTSLNGVIFFVAFMVSVPAPGFNGPKWAVATVVVIGVASFLALFVSLPAYVSLFSRLEKWAVEPLSHLPYRQSEAADRREATKKEARDIVKAEIERKKARNEKRQRR